MSQRTYILTTAIVFSVIALLQMVRLLMRWEVALNGRPVPLWLSAVAVVIAGSLAFAGFQVARKCDGPTT